MHHRKTGSEEIDLRNLIGRDLFDEIERDPERERIEAEEKARIEAETKAAAKAARIAAILKQQLRDKDARKAEEKTIKKINDIVSQLKLIEKNIISTLSKNDKIKHIITSYTTEVDSLKSKKDPSQKTQQTIKEVLEKIAEMEITNNRINKHSAQIIKDIQQLLLRLESTEIAPPQDKELKTIREALQQFRNDSSRIGRGISEINKLSQKIENLNRSILQAQNSAAAPTPKSKTKPTPVDDLAEIEEAIAKNKRNMQKQDIVTRIFNIIERKPFIAEELEANLLSLERIGIKSPANESLASVDSEIKILDKAIIENNLEAFIFLLKRKAIINLSSIELALNHQSPRYLVYIIENEGISQCLNFIKSKKSSQDDYLHVLKYAIGIALFKSYKKGIDLKPEIQLNLEKLSKPQQRKILDFISDEISKSLFGEILVDDKMENLTHDFLSSLITNRADCTKKIFEKDISVEPTIAVISTLNPLEKFIMTARVTKIIGDLISETIDKKKTDETSAFMTYMTKAFSSFYEINFNELISTTSEFHSPDVEVELDEARAAEDRRIINYGECIHDTKMLQSLF